MRRTIEAIFSIFEYRVLADVKYPNNEGCDTITLSKECCVESRTFGIWHWIVTFLIAWNTNLSDERNVTRSLVCFFCQLDFFNVLKPLDRLDLNAIFLCRMLTVPRKEMSCCVNKYCGMLFRYQMSTYSFVVC